MARLRNSRGCQKKYGGGETITDGILFFAKIVANDPWRKEWGLVLSVVVAVVLGLLTAYFLNWDTLHRLLRRLGVTRETSYASEWYSAFSRHSDCYVTRHLKGERRLSAGLKNGQVVPTKATSESRKLNGWLMAKMEYLRRGFQQF